MVETLPTLSLFPSVASLLQLYLSQLQLHFTGLCRTYQGYEEGS